MFANYESRSEQRTVVHKRKKSFVSCSVLFLMILLHCHANAKSKLDELSTVVVYLHNKQVRTVVRDGIEREIYLEKKGTGEVGQRSLVSYFGLVAWPITETKSDKLWAAQPRARVIAQ